jgi:acyl dehydratase
MRRGRPRGGTRPAQADALPAVARWSLDAASGRRYAALSGDWNPIHLWPWSARLMGMRAPIIHGMHTLGRACAELERAGGRPIVALDGRFRAPAALGSTLVLAAALESGRFGVAADGRSVAEGAFRYG